MEVFISASEVRDRASIIPKRNYVQAAAQSWQPIHLLSAAFGSRIGGNHELKCAAVCHFRPNTSPRTSEYCFVAETPFIS